MIARFLCAALLLSSVALARVTFTYSEVLQDTDLTAANGNRAAFKCAHGCKIYTDIHANNLVITEYNEQTKNYAIITNFNAIGASPSNDVQPLPDPYNLKAGNNYFIENRGEKDPKFVFYVVDNNSPNHDIPVMIVTDDWGLWLNDGSRMVTILSSKFNAVRYYNFTGPFTAGYPRIYTVGYDAVAELQCSPLYQARSQENAEQTAISVFSPISTVDYGTAGVYGTDSNHNVIVNWNENGQITKDGESSVAYSSPGYVGCSYNGDQSYSSASNSIQDSFKFTAESLDVKATLHLTTAEDALHLTVNDDNFSLIGTPSFTKHYNADSYNVFVKWNRKLSNANFALQLDFGLGKTGVTGTTSSPISTTSGASWSSLFVSIFASIFFVLC